MYSCMFWVTLSADSTSLQLGGDTKFLDANMIYVGLRLKFPIKEWGQPQSMKDNEMNDTEVIFARH